MIYVFQTFVIDSQYRILEGEKFASPHNNGVYCFRGKVLKSTRNDFGRGYNDFSCPLYENGIAKDFVYSSFEELIENHFCEILQ